jgi:hypothetical protein
MDTLARFNRILTGAETQIRATQLHLHASSVALQQAQKGLDQSYRVLARHRESTHDESEPHERQDRWRRNRGETG